MALFPETQSGTAAVRQSQTGTDGDMCPSAEMESDPSVSVWSEGI